MISSKLKQHFIKKKIGKLLTNHEVRSTNEVNKKIASVGIITQEELFTQYDLQSLVTDQLGLRNPRVYSYRKFEKHQEASFKHFSEQDFNWKAEIIQPSLQSFLDHPFDLLICFYPKRHSILEYSTLLSKASFKIGFAGINSDLFDLEIALESSELDDFLFEARKYLTILQKI